MNILYRENDLGDTLMELSYIRRSQRAQRGPNPGVSALGQFDREIRLL